MTATPITVVESILCYDFYLNKKVRITNNNLLIIYRTTILILKNFLQILPIYMHVTVGQWVSRSEGQKGNVLPT